MSEGSAVPPEPARRRPQPRRRLEAVPPPSAEPSAGAELPPTSADAGPSTGSDGPSGAAPSADPPPATSEQDLLDDVLHRLAVVFASRARRPAEQWLREAAEQVARAALDLAAPGESDRAARAGEALTFLRRRLSGDYAVDDFGFDPELTDAVLLSLARPLYRSWFRVDVSGAENLPATGAGLVVANHSGAVAFDALMTAVAVHDEHPAHRHLRMLGADFVFGAPVLGELARRGGVTLATNADAERLLLSGELVGVWPEGFKGIGKPFRERYKLQRFGRGGFVAAALRTGAPLIPCAIVGAEETYPVIGFLPGVAKVLGLPYLPITPTFPWLGPLGLVPLPSKWLIEFGEPVGTSALGAAAADDPMVVFDLTDQVRDTIQQTLYTLLVRRRSVFL